jgi:hypothetical protein
VTGAELEGAKSGSAPRVGRATLALTAAALLARTAFLLLVPQCHTAGDEPSWIALGTQELVPLSPLRNDLIFYPPVYPYFIALVWRATGSLQAVLWVQAAIGALLVPAVVRVGARSFGPRAGLLAGALAAFYPELLWFATRFWSETLFVVLLWWAIERTLAAGDDGKPATAAWAGALWALATLTRELALYLVPLAALYLVWSRPPPGGGLRAWLRPARSRVIAAAALVLTPVLVIAPWTIRNALVFKAFIPVSTMGGLNLWQGNTTLTHLQIYEVLARIDGPVAQDRYCRRMAWETIGARQPAWIVEKLGEQMPEFWKPGSEVLDHVVGREACGPVSTATLVAIELVLVLPYLALLVAGAIGLSRLRFGPAAVWLLALLAAYNAAHVAAYATTRFRLPVMPVVFFVAAAAIVGLRDRSLLPVRGFRMALLVVLLLAGCAVLWPGFEELTSWRLLTSGG